MLMEIMHKNFTPVINNEVKVFEISLNKEYQSARLRINDVYSGSGKDREDYLRIFTESQRS